jgi:hypothetical protein
MSVDTLNKALRIMGCGQWSRRRQRRARPTLDRVDPSQRRGRFDGDVVEAQLAHDAEKKDAGGATR